MNFDAHHTKRELQSEPKTIISCITIKRYNSIIFFDLKKVGILFRLSDAFVEDDGLELVGQLSSIKFVFEGVDGGHQLDEGALQFFDGPAGS